MMQRQWHNVVLTLVEPMLGTKPKNKEIYATYIAGKAKELHPEKAEEIDAEVEEIGEIEDRGWTGFSEDAEGYFIYDYQIKGLLKENGMALQAELGIRSLKNKIEKFVLVLPRKIRVARIDDLPLERPLRVFVPGKGEISTLTRSDQAPVGTELKFKISILKNPGKDKRDEINLEVIEALLDHGQFKGLGQWRSGGYGRFTYTIAEAGPSKA